MHESYRRERAVSRQKGLGRAAGQLCGLATEAIKYQLCICNDE